MRWWPGCCYGRRGWRQIPSSAKGGEPNRRRPHTKTGLTGPTGWAQDLLVGDDCLYASHQRNACANPRDAQLHLDRPSGLTTTASNQLGGSAGVPIERLTLATAR